MVKVEIIKDSINAQGDRITTFMCSLTQTVVKELLRHRMFSFSSSSMRAIPAGNVTAETRKDFFLPTAWQKKHKGMQGNEYWKEADVVRPLKGDDFELSSLIHFENEWMAARDSALMSASHLEDMGVTKQLTNRLIETFGFANILITMTESENFYDLRCPIYEHEGRQFKSWRDLLGYLFDKGASREEVDYYENFSVIQKLEKNVSQAEIHIQELAEAMWDAHNESEPEFLNPGEWHIPFGDRMDDDGINEVLKLDEVKYNYWDDIDGEHVELMISAARAARLSYNTFEGEIDHVKDYKLAKLLLKEGHMSPFEHSAQCMSEKEYSECVKTVWCKDTQQFYQEEGWLANFRGFKQFRQLL